MSEGEQVAQTTQKGQGKQQEHEQERSFEPRPKNTTKLHIKNLQYNTPKEEVNELCRRFGTITVLDVKGTSAFVTFSKPDEAQLAIHKLDGTTHKGFALRVQFAREPLPNKDGKKEEKPATPVTNTNAKPEEKKPEEKKLTFAQQQQLAKAKPAQQKQSFQAPKEEKPKQPEQGQQQGQGKAKKNKVAQQNQQGKGAQKQQQGGEQKKELRSYKVSVEKTVINEGDKKEEGFTFSVSHQQYLDYIIPLLKDIQSKKEQEKEQGAK